MRKEIQPPSLLSLKKSGSSLCDVPGTSNILISLAAGNTFLASNEVQCQLKVVPHRKTFDKIAIFKYKKGSKYAIFVKGDCSVWSDPG